MADSNLLSKLKFRPEYRMVVINAPENYSKSLEGVQYSTNFSDIEGEIDMLHVFAHNKADVDRFIPEAIKHLKYDGLLWMSYPKGTSRIKTDINRDKGWDTLKTLGFEGIALIAIDDTWAAMRFRPKEKVKGSRSTQ
jgi:predicted CoA-binding protein